MYIYAYQSLSSMFNLLHIRYMYLDIDIKTMLLWIIFSGDRISDSKFMG